VEGLAEEPRGWWTEPKGMEGPGWRGKRDERQKAREDAGVR
jgi:hypothetical protein